jgi:protein-L-isoaspartate(D-aspartate) O-methyltransferase
MWMAALGAACQTAAEPDASATDLSSAFRTVREEMVQRYIRGQGIEDPRVLDAMRAVRREEFVLYRDRFEAYNDTALPIQEGQTISQPFIVAQMTELLDLEPGDSVLEVGTGSGYQAAVLAKITDEVYSIEIIPLLAREAEVRLARLGYDKVKLKQDDGYFGWEEYAPFDAIIVTAAPDHVPQPLLRQLKDGGRMVLPVGPPGAVQTLWHIRREGDEFRRVNMGLVVFVPLLRTEP